MPAAAASHPRPFVDRKISSMLGEKTEVKNTGAANLTITSLYLKLSDLDTGKVTNLARAGIKSLNTSEVPVAQLEGTKLRDWVGL